MAKDIIIIGAGAAGLMAANELLERGFNVIILEARNRIGGRIDTITNKFSTPVEGGAEFIHGEQPVTKALAAKANAQLSRLAGKHYQVVHGKLKSGDFFDAGWDTLLNELQKLTTDMTMEAFLERYFNKEQYKDLYKSVKGFVEGYDAADLARVSALALREEWTTVGDEHQYHIVGGYEKLMHYLKEKIASAGGSVVLSSPVREIQWSMSGIKVSVSQTVYEADKVVVTVPLGVLQKGSISFNPEIPSYQKAFKAMGFGGVVKVLVEFKQSFWDKQVDGQFTDMAFIFSDAQIPTWWSQLPDKTPVLTGWLGGPSINNETHTPESLHEKTMASLSYLFNCSVKEVIQQLKECYIIDWLSDPYAYGAYAYATVETNAARKVLLKPVANAVYFAGEAIYEGAAMGTVEAALVSGKNVAEAVHRDNASSADMLAG